MHNQIDGASNDELRRKALQLLKQKVNNSGAIYSEAEAEAQKLLHELQVYQIELELQNEELNSSRAEAAAIAEKYSALYEFAPAGYVTLAEGSVVQEINLHGSTLLGIPRSALLNTPFQVHILNESRPVFSDFLALVSVSGLQETCEIAVPTDTGGLRYLHLNGIYNEKVGHVIVTMIDITRQRLAEEQLVAAQDKAEESDRLKSAFLANMSHEIRTPMNGIMGFTWLLKEPMLTGEQQAEYIDVIEQSGTRMLNVINDIISISKVEAGLIELDITQTNVNKQIDYIATFFRPEIHDRNLQLIVTKPLPDDEVFFETDREKLYAILTNIVKNAIKFTPEGSIELGYQRKEDQFVFFVRDTGIGFDAEQREIIFDRFRQGSDAAPRKYEGSGLGLSISKAFVEMLGGVIWAESEKGKGASFYFTLPCDGEKIDSSVPDVSSPDKVPGRRMKLLKILIAEDDAISDRYLTHVVGPYSREILHVRSGKDAVECCLNDSEIDLVLMDIRMMELDGYEATRLIREQRDDVVIIAQSALALSNEREVAMEAGCDDYIAKPIDHDELIAMIKSYFHMPSTAV
ncbi:MAG: ATP-binding protein [Bacteroidota bacterium]